MRERKRERPNPELSFLEETGILDQITEGGPIATLKAELFVLRETENAWHVGNPIELQVRPSVLMREELPGDVVRKSER